MAILNSLLKAATSPYLPGPLGAISGALSAAKKVIAPSVLPKPAAASMQPGANRTSTVSAPQVTTPSFMQPKPNVATSASIASAYPRATSGTTGSTPKDKYISQVAAPAALGTSRNAVPGEDYATYSARMEASGPGAGTTPPPTGAGTGTGTTPPKKGGTTQYSAAAQAYIDSLKESPRVTDARKRYQDFVYNRDKASNTLEQSPIAMTFIRGNQQSLLRNTQLTEQRLLDDKQGTESQQNADRVASKALYDVETEQQRIEREAAKPIEIGDSLVRLNPETGQYEQVYNQPKSTTPKFGPIGTDPSTGATQYGFIDEAGGKVNPYQLPSSGNGSGAPQLTAKQRETAMSLSQNLAGRQEYKDALDIQAGLTGVASGLSSNSGIGDITAINALQRMIDPGVSVREGDVTLLTSASPTLARFFSNFPIEKLRTGAKLPEAVRQEMQSIANQLYQNKVAQYNANTGSLFQNQAAAAGIPFEGLIGNTFLADPTQALIKAQVDSGKDAGGIVNNLLQANSTVRGQVLGMQQSGASPDEIVEFFYPPYGEGGDLDALVTAIGEQESSNNYTAVGPDTGGGKALGKYQVMDYNVGPWTQEILGTAMTPQQFLASPQAQDAVARGKLGQYLAQHGTIEDAASIWFSGRPLAGNTSRDVLGTSVPQYVEGIQNRIS